MCTRFCTGMRVVGPAFFVGKRRPLVRPPGGPDRIGQDGPNTFIIRQESEMQKNLRIDLKKDNRDLNPEKSGLIPEKKKDPRCACRGDCTFCYCAHIREGQ